MNLDDYENFPEGMKKEDVKHLFTTWLSHQKTEEGNITLSKLDILSDIQWHTYESPDDDVKQFLTQWILDKLDTTTVNNELLDIMLGASYCFGLKKALFKDILKMYSGENLDEYKQNLIESKGEDIDPYWTM